MFTVCPKCTLTLAVTANDLRMGQGYVRCGRCANVFNALLSLSEEPADEHGSPAADSSAPGSGAPDTAAPGKAAGDAAGDAAGAAAAEAGGAAPGTTASGTSADSADPLYSSHDAAAPAERASEPAHPSGMPHAHAEPTDGPSMHLATEKSSDGSIENESNFAEGTGTFETIVLEGDGITQTEEYVPEASVDSEIALLTRRLGMAAHEPVATTLHGAEEFTAGEADVFGEPAATSPHGGRARWPWIAGSAALLLLLAVQAIHHWRDALAGSPSWYAALSRSYAALGLPLDPHWDLAAYDLRQQGAAADPSDNQVVRVRLSLANHAERAQPLPLLRLTLLDRYGKRVASSELTPAQYWPAGAPARTSLAHDERVDSEIAVRDPGAASASFELDVCLRGSAGLRCASDASANPATAGAVSP